MTMKIVIVLGLTVTVLFLSGCIGTDCDCDTDGKSFTKIGIVSSIEFYGDSDIIEFEDGSHLRLHGSPNAEYSLLTMENLIVVGQNYTFFYHHECVWDDGNNPTCHEGNVIDRIDINEKEIFLLYHL